MKQIVEIIKDCRKCPNYIFSERYPGGVVFTCQVSNKYEDRLIPYQRLDKVNFIHPDCSLEDKK